MFSTASPPVLGLTSFVKESSYSIDKILRFLRNTRRFSTHVSAAPKLHKFEIHEMRNNYLFKTLANMIR